MIELDVPSKIFPRFHVQLIKRASEDPLPSQKRDDTQPPPVFPNNENSMGENEPEQFVERIIRVEKFRRVRGWVRRVLVKWKNFAEPNWEDRSNLENAIALDKFEQTYGKGDGVGEEEGARQGKPSRTKKKKRKQKIYKKKN